MIMTQPPDFRAELERLASETEYFAKGGEDSDRAWAAINRARAALSAAPQLVEATTSVCGRRVTQVEAGNPPSEYVLTGQAEPQQGAPSVTPDDFRRWWRETGSASPAPSPEMLLTANAWANYCLTRYGAQAVAVGVTDEELIKTYCDARRTFYFENAAGDSDQEDRKAATISGLRAVLSRCGTAHPAPVPVGERPPGVKDVLHRNGDGWCWGQERSTITGQAAARWRFMRVSALEDEAVNRLPHWALPLPQSEAQP